MDNTIICSRTYETIESSKYSRFEDPRLHRNSACLCIHGKQNESTRIASLMNTTSHLLVPFRPLPVRTQKKNRLFFPLFLAKKVVCLHFFEKARQKRESCGVMALFKWLMKFRSDKRMFLSGLIILVAIFTKLES